MACTVPKKYEVQCTYEKFMNILEQIVNQRDLKIRLLSGQNGVHIIHRWKL